MLRFTCSVPFTHVLNSPNQPWPLRKGCMEVSARFPTPAGLTPTSYLQLTGSAHYDNTCQPPPPPPPSSVKNQMKHFELKSNNNIIISLISRNSKMSYGMSYKSHLSEIISYMMGGEWVDLFIDYILRLQFKLQALNKLINHWNDSVRNWNNLTSLAIQNSHSLRGRVLSTGLKTNTRTTQHALFRIQGLYQQRGLFMFAVKQEAQHYFLYPPRTATAGYTIDAFPWLMTGPTQVDNKS